MFENAGKKIKEVAKWVFVVQCVAVVITAIALIATDDDLTPVALLILLAGPLVFWLSALLLYGFGEIVDTAIINRKEQPVAPVVQEAPVVPDEPVTEPEPEQSQNLTECPKCGSSLYMNNTYCGKCGEFVVKGVF